MWLVSGGSRLPGLQVAALCLGLHAAFSLSVEGLGSPSSLPFFQGTSPIGLGTHPVTSFSVSYLTKGPISKYCRIEGKGSGIQHTNLGRM